MAVTLALRGSRFTRARSPKKLCSLNTTSSFSVPSSCFFVTRTLPFDKIKNWVPVSP
eukprot:CAMPEP_0182538052 /NCGR_PEP_ID=MMETSP1323-20130603/23065_1 /TAXON_ID=236787 /ORGANISM="Florenciella parvula, Strain RCC1693" /LENGTH=56 /DNA_ID=CAMNT_0024748497 /DNA_START=310 /DNA_END=477 /DNA_ORIENTATION=-